MRRVRALDKRDGTPVGLIEAATVTEATRRAYDYQCRYNGCDCKMHWRKAVHGKANTEPHPPTFAKNPSSSHRNGCPGDIESIHRENVDYTTLINGQIHIRVNFPLGSSRVDRYPLRGYLGKQYIEAAKAQREIQPFGSVSALAKFFEKNFGGIESDGASEVVVHYQGREVEWGKLFKGSDRYNKLYLRTQNLKHSDKGKDTPPIITIVRPVKELEATSKGNRKFECEEQHVTIQGRKQRVVPVIVCDQGNANLAEKLSEYVTAGAPMLISARPFHPGATSRPSQIGEQRVSMFIHTLEQIGPIDEKYWHPSMVPSPQKDFFGQQKMVPARDVHP